MKGVTRSPMMLIGVTILLMVGATAVRPVLYTIMEFIRGVAPYIAWGVVLFLATVVVLRVLNGIR